MIDTTKLSDGELRKLFSEPLSEQEAEAMREADEAARPFLAIVLCETPDLMEVEFDEAEVE